MYPFLLFVLLILFIVASLVFLYYLFKFTSSYDKTLTSSLDKYGWTIIGMGTLVGCSTLGEANFISFGSTEIAFGFLVFIFSFFIAGFMFVFGQHYDKNEAKRNHIRDLKEFSKQLDDCRNVAISFKLNSNFDIETAITWKHVYYYEGRDSLPTDVVWKNKNTLVFGMSEKTHEFYLENIILPRLKEKKVIFSFQKYPNLQFSIKNIVYYKSVGQISKETRTVGGGSSLSGAIIGGIVAGDLGAMIGSRKESSIETFTNDEREIEFVVISDKGTIEKIYFDYKVKDAFDQLIPEKDYDFVKLNLKV